MTTGGSNTGIGRNALGSATTGSNNSAVGLSSAFRTTTGSSNVAVGQDSLYYNETGSQNTAVGMSALQGGSVTNHSLNSALGYRSGFDITTGVRNSLMGAYAGHNLTTGYYNTFSGYAAGETATTGYENVCIGYSSDISSADGNNQVVVGYNLTGKGNDTGFFGGASVYNEANTTTWNTTSDRRIKKNIVDNNDGLSLLMQLQVRNFEYRTPDEIDELPSSSAVDVQGVQLGVIAQEIQQVIPETVKEESTGCLTVDPDRLTWYLINAVKELKSELDAANARIEQLESN